MGTESLATLGVNAAYDLTAATVAAPTSLLNTADVTTVDNSNKVLVQIDAALQQIATSGAQLGAYQNRFTAAITRPEHGRDQPDERPQLDPGHRLRAGDFESVEGADSAAGQHGDGGAGQHDSAEHTDAAAEAAVRTDAP